MNNAWYDRINGSCSFAQPIFQNPMQKVQYIMQAMQNPVVFVKQQFPDVPDNILSDPNQVLRYLQQTRGISNDQINQIVGQFPGR